MSKSWEGGSTRAYRRTRAAVLDRDRWRCQVRRAGCLGRASEAHHTRGRAVTGDDPRFMVAACQPCNLAVGDPTAADPDPRPTPRTRW